MLLLNQLITTNPKRFLETSVVGDVFALRIDPIDFETILRYRVVAILFNDTLGTIAEIAIRHRVPPVHVVAVLVKLSATIIKTVRDLMSNHETNGSEIEIAILGKTNLKINRISKLD